METNIKPIKIDEIKEKSKVNEKNDKSGFIRIDSPNSDNESIYFKFNNISNQKNVIEYKRKTSQSHDKEIKEDSIIYFTKKIKNNNIDYHRYLYISIIIYLTDVIIWYCDKQLFHESLNLYSLLLILGITIIQIFLFRHNFKSITKSIYVSTQRIIYLFSISLVIYFINLSFISYFGIIHNFGNKNHIFNYPILKLTFLDFSLIIFFYIIINAFVPIMVFVKLIFILRNIKKTLSAKGEIYKTVKINDSQINSMIN